MTVNRASVAEMIAAMMNNGRTDSEIIDVLKIEELSDILRFYSAAADPLVKGYAVRVVTPGVIDRKLDAIKAIRYCKNQVRYGDDIPAFGLKESKDFIEGNGYLRMDRMQMQWAYDYLKVNFGAICKSEALTN